MALLKIDGVEMPAPSVFKIPQFDLDSGDTKRNEEGYLQRDRVRQGIYKIELEWRSITKEQLEVIRNAIEPASLQVVFLENETKTMYAGDRNIELITVFGGTTLWNISFNLTEY